MPVVTNVGALNSVTTDGATLAGNGTAGAPLGVAGWPLTWFSFGEAGLSTTFNKFGHTANTYAIFGLVIPAAVKAGHLILNIHADDATHASDAGFYNSAGSLIANIGATDFAATGILSFAFLQGSVLFTPGRYYFGTTSVATTATFYTTNDTITPQSFYFAQDLGATVGGVLNSTIVPPADAPNATGPIFSLTV